MDQKLKLLSGAIGAAMLLPAHAAAAPVTNSDGRAIVEILDPLAVVEVSDLDFGTVVTSPLAGTVFLPADGSAPVYAGGVTGLPADPLFRGEFIVAGVAGSDVIVTHSWPAKLTSVAGDQIDLLVMYLDGPPVKTLNGFGQATLYFGGTIMVPANTPDGTYEEFFNVTVDYR